MNIGSYNVLQVGITTTEGVLLNGAKERILLPFANTTEVPATGEDITVFLFHNKEGEVIATQKHPIACVGDFAALKVVGGNDKGVFLDIGIEKDVFLPKREQKKPLMNGDICVAYLYLDERDEKITASTYLEEFADTDPDLLEEGEEVNLLIADVSPLGYTAIINNNNIGLIYRDEVYEDLEIGEERTGYIKRIRENKKIDLSLRAVGFDFILESRDHIFELLKANGGVLNFGDKSAPEDIRHHLKMSKKAFKQTIGGLYKQRLITISDYEIRLVDQSTIDPEAE